MSWVVTYLNEDALGEDDQEPVSVYIFRQEESQWKEDHFESGAKCMDPLEPLSIPFSDIEALYLPCEMASIRDIS